MAIERRAYLAVVGGAVAALAGCSSSGTGAQADETTSSERDTTTATTQTTATTTAEPLTDVTVGMHTKSDAEVYYFDPVGVHVAPGTTVTFELESGGHSTTAYSENNPEADTRRIPDGADSWDSGVMTTVGETFEYTFDVEGTYDYYCIPHKPFGMVGRVVCGDPGGPAEGSMPPDGDVPESDRILREGSVSHADFRG